MMSQAPSVFIIVVNWNGKEDTLQCLESLRGLAYPNYTTILVDNGSRDGSVAAVRSHFPEVTILDLPENLRFAGGNNKGIELAMTSGAEFVLLLNNDTVVPKDFLGYLVDRIQSDTTIGMVAPKVCYFSSPDTIWFAGARIRFWTGTMAHIGIRERDQHQFDVAGETDYATGCCVLVSRTVIEAIGMLDESYFMYVEDADWSVRARQAGFRVFYEPRASILHKVSASAGGNLSWFKLRNKYLSQTRFFFRYASWYHWLVFPWMSILINLSQLLKQAGLLVFRPAVHQSAQRKTINGKD